MVFLDDDDLIVNTYLECAYLTLEANKQATWAYTDVVNFSEESFLWTKIFDSNVEKRENLLVATAMIKKQDFIKINGYELKEKAVHEDWNLWLKFLAEGMFPVRMNFYGFWYRRKKATESELQRAKNNKNRAMSIINETAKKIKGKVDAIQYPKQDYEWNEIKEFDNIEIPILKNKEKINILIIIPWMTMGGADKFNLDLIKGLDKNKFEITLVCTEPNINQWRQQFEEFANAVYDLTTFLDRKYWTSFINYIIKKENINIIINSNSTFGYAALPYIKSCNPMIPILDYIHMEEWYNRNGGFSRDSSAVSEVIDKTLVCNENSRNILINHFNRMPDEIETVYIGVDEEKFNPDKYDKEELLKKYNIEKNKLIISYIARIDIQKRPYLLIDIIKKLKKERNDFLVLIAGDGPLLKPIKKAVNKNNLNEVVKFLGAVKKTAEIYCISDITINCSIKEGLALTSYESLSMGVPVISSNVGGQKELIDGLVGEIVPCLQDETDILKFNYSDEEINQYVKALNKVISNLENYKSNCRKKILNGFTIDQMISRMSELLIYTAENPNQEKSSKALNLKTSKNILKELITHYFVAHSNEYSWLCKQTIDSFLDDEYILKQSNVTSERFGIKLKTIKILIKLHIYNEAKQIYKLVKLTYLYVKNLMLLTYMYIKNIIIEGFNFIKLVLNRIGNLFKKGSGNRKDE